MRNIGSLSAVLLAAVLLLCFGSSPALAAASSRRSEASVEVILTRVNLRPALRRMPDLHFSAHRVAGPVLAVDEHTRFQAIRGVGAAMTDTSAWLIEDQLPAAAREQLMNRLFGAGGLHLSFIRIVMGASDFTAGRTPYSYDDMPPGESDPTLGHFSVGHDEAYILPALREALSLNPDAFVLASPWSPPGWMKSNDALDNVGGRGSLKPSSMGPLAQYFVKFIEAYERAGVPISAVTPQNEPGARTSYPGMNLSASTEAAFVRSDLAPALRTAGLATSIFGYDYGWSAASSPFALSLLAGPARGELAGVASHCYFGSPALMNVLHRQDPALEEIVSECSPGITPFSTSELEISSMRNWASTVALWNLALDPSGGPVQEPNHGCPGCTGVATINERTHSFALTRDYYELGQLAEFVHAGAVRIGSTNFVRYRYPGPGVDIATPGLDDVAFENPDGSRVLLAYDNSAARIPFSVRNDGRSFSYTLAPGATVTFVWHRPA